jgi:hypothetical protein
MVALCRSIKAYKRLKQFAVTFDCHWSVTFYRWLELDVTEKDKEIISCTVKSSQVRPTVSRPVCLGVRQPSRTRDQFLFLSSIIFRQLLIQWWATSLTRSRVCSFELNIFYCLEFETPPTWRAMFLYLFPPGSLVFKFRSKPYLYLWFLSLDVSLICITSF